MNPPERGQLLRHRLLRERNEGKLTLNSMITIASNYAAAAADARKSLKASAIDTSKMYLLSRTLLLLFLL
jgi:hypothetical protein